LLTTADAAKILGVGVARVRQLDDVLNPLRLSDGQRAYSRERVERLRDERAAKAVAR
jgi:hypothetical protein